MDSEEFAQVTTAVATEVALSESTWHLFGFSRRPRRGAWFERFAARKKLERERFLLRELTASTMIASVRLIPPLGAEHSRLAYAARALEMLADADGVPRAYGFASPMDLKDWFVESMAAYAATRRSDFASLFLNRARRHLEEPPPGTWLLGVARLFADPDSPLEGAERFLRNQLDQPLRGNLKLVDVQLVDQLDTSRGTSTMDQHEV